MQFSYASAAFLELMISELLTVWAFLEVAVQGVRLQAKSTLEGAQDELHGQTSAAEVSVRASSGFVPSTGSRARYPRLVHDLSSAESQVAPAARWSQPTVMMSQSPEVYEDRRTALLRLAGVSFAITHASYPVLAASEGDMIQYLAARKIGETVRSGGPFPLTVGFGTYLMNEPTAIDSVKTAIKEGYRLFDTAQLYANEAAVGEAIAASIKDGILKREDVFVTTKVWISNMGFNKTVASTRLSAERLSVQGSAGSSQLSTAASRATLSESPVKGAIDLMLVHFPGQFLKRGVLGADALNRNLRRETWEALEMLQEAGEVKQIGVSNYGERHLKELLNYAKIKPIVNQIEIHPYNQRSDLVKFCKSKGIAVEAYSPLGGKGSQAQVTDELLNDPVLKSIANVYGRTVPQVILRWLLQRGTTPIPKASSEGRIHENYDVFQFALNDADMNAISKLDRGQFVIFDADTLA